MVPTLKSGVVIDKKKMIIKEVVIDDFHIAGGVHLHDRTGVVLLCVFFLRVFNTQIITCVQGYNP